MAGTLSITSPAVDNETGHDSSSLPIVWAFAGTASATQVQWRVTMKRSGGGSNPLLIDTGWTTSGATTYTVSGLSNSIFYDVTVQMTDTAGSTTSATRTVVSRYTRAVPPVVTVTTTEAALLVSVANPTSGDRPAAIRNRVYRRIAGSRSDWEQIAIVAPDSSYLDRQVRSGESYEYFARGEQ